MKVLDFLVPKSTSGEQDVEAALDRLILSQQALHVEVEGANVRFQSVISRKGDMILVAKPNDMARPLAMGSILRVQVPNSPKELRLEVIQAHLNLKNGQGAIVCKVPSQVASNNREGGRIDTSGYNNIHLVLPNVGEKFSVVDMSPQGFRVRVSSSNRLSLFPLGNKIPHAAIQAQKYTFNLDLLVPRSHRGLTVGFEAHGDMTNGLSLPKLVEFIERMQHTHTKEG